MNALDTLHIGSTYEVKDSPFRQVAQSFTGRYAGVIDDCVTFFTGGDIIRFSDWDFNEAMEHGEITIIEREEPTMNDEAKQDPYEQYRMMAALVARELGSSGYSDYYRDRFLTIRYAGDTGCHVELNTSPQRTLVFESRTMWRNERINHHDVLRFRPGQWTVHLEVLYATAKAKADARQAAEDAEEAARFNPVDDADLFAHPPEEPEPSKPVEVKYSPEDTLVSALKHLIEQVLDERA